MWIFTLGIQSSLHVQKSANTAALLMTSPMLWVGVMCVVLGKGLFCNNIKILWY